MGYLVDVGAGGVTVTSTGGNMHLNGGTNQVTVTSGILDVNASGAVTLDGTSLDVTSTDNTNIIMNSASNNNKILFPWYAVFNLCADGAFVLVYYIQTRAS